VRQADTIMDVSFATDELQELCSTAALLTRRFGADGLIVRRRLLVLRNAPRLRDVTTTPPDRRRLEPAHGPHAVSVCAKDAGRIYFRAGTRGRDPASGLEDAQAIEIFAIGEGGR
jgi:hypothetical protein